MPKGPQHFPVDLKIEITQSGNKHVGTVFSSHIDFPKKFYPIPLSKEGLDTLLLPDNRNDGIVHMMMEKDRNNEEWLDKFCQATREIFRLLFPISIFGSAFIELLSSGKIKVIHIITDGFSVPWELLYWDDKLGKIESFLGYNAFICRDERLLPQEDGTYLTSRNEWMTTSGTCAIGGIFDFSFPWAKKEDKFFESLTGTDLQYKKLPPILFRKDNPANSGRNLLKNFLENLDDWKNFGWTICHFSCHAEYDPDIKKCSIRISEDFYISLLELIDAQIVCRKKPLVFLNCCESGAVLNRFSANFSSLFFSHLDASGVIATPCIIDDHSAGKFALQFYKNLCEKRMAISEAAIQARRDLYQKDEDITGFYYMFYARPDAGVTFV